MIWWRHDNLLQKNPVLIKRTSTTIENVVINPYDIYHNGNVSRWATLHKNIQYCTIMYRNRSNKISLSQLQCFQREEPFFLFLMGLHTSTSIQSHNTNTSPLIQKLTLPHSDKYNTVKDITQSILKQWLTLGSITWYGLKGLFICDIK